MFVCDMRAQFAHILEHLRAINALKPLQIGTIIEMFLLVGSHSHAPPVGVTPFKHAIDNRVCHCHQLILGKSSHFDHLVNQGVEI